ncbi:MAG TPA: MBL fold metallo-hydrolase [Bacillota bacterium]|nr:MBL fold metallo-hydrolase [Bacillota bacterium]
MIKRILVLLLAALLLLSFSACSTGINTSGSTSTSDTQSDSGSGLAQYVDPGKVKVRMFKIGKADATLIRTENYTFLIDTGETDDAVEILEYFAEKEIKYIDYLVISMFDDDHVGGAAAIIAGIEVKNVIQPNYEEKSDEYLAYIAALETAGITPTVLTEDMTVTLNDATIKLYASDRSQYTDYKDENASIIITMQHGDNSFLFASDAQSERLAELVKANLGSFTFLKVPDHGTLNDKSEAFINMVSANIAAITCSSKNPASSDVISYLKNAGATVYLTANGAIKLTSNGSSLSVKQGATLEGDE